MGDRLTSEGASTTRLPCGVRRRTSGGSNPLSGVEEHRIHGPHKVLHAPRPSTSLWTRKPAIRRSPRGCGQRGRRTAREQLSQHREHHRRDHSRQCICGRVHCGFSSMFVGTDSKWDRHVDHWWEWGHHSWSKSKKVVDAIVSRDEDRYRNGWKDTRSGLWRRLHWCRSLATGTANDPVWTLPGASVEDRRIHACPEHRADDLLSPESRRGRSTCALRMHPDRGCRDDDAPVDRVQPLEAPTHRSNGDVGRGGPWKRAEFGSYRPRFAAGSSVIVATAPSRPIATPGGTVTSEVLTRRARRERASRRTRGRPPERRRTRRPGR